MFKKLLALGTAAVIMTSVVIAEEAAKEEPKLTEVKVCPMMQAPIKGEGVGSTVVGTYKVFFCCGGCPKAFAKLSKEDQQKKVDAAVKVQEEAAKKAAG